MEMIPNSEGTDHVLTHQQIEWILASWVHLGTQTTVRRPIKIDQVVERIIADLGSKRLIIDETQSLAIIRFLDGNYPSLKAAILAARTIDQASRIRNLARKDLVDLSFPPVVTPEPAKFEPRGPWFSFVPRVWLAR